MNRLFTFVALLLLTSSVMLHAQDRSVILSYKTDTAPTIDGEIDGDEWDAAGPWIMVTSESPHAQPALDLIADDVFGGNEDMSFRFKTMWVEDTPNFYVVYEVFDDIAMEVDPVNLWERDQIETFIDGTSLEGDDDPASFHWWDASGETYGKLGVSRYNTFEGNGGTMTDDIDAWDEGFGGFNSISAVADMDTNADYRIEMGISILQMIDDLVAAPFANSPTEDAVAIVEDSTTLKFTASISDHDNFEAEGTERSGVVTYYRELDGEPADWDVSTAFSTMTFVGMFDGVLEVPGDCNGDGVLDNSDLACAAGDEIDVILSGLNVLPGDFDGVGGVAFPDFLVLSANFGKPVAGYAQGDIDGNGMVAFPDFLVMSANFGKSAGATAAVPEPAGVVLLSMATLALGVIRRRHR